MGQDAHSTVDVSTWPSDEEFPVYPEGAREKRAVFCPEQAPFQFLIGTHRYLLKFSVPWAIEQYWGEIIAYRLGGAMGVEVPPAYVAIDGHGRSGALIEFFLGRPGHPAEAYVAGGDTMQRLIPGYDRKRGNQHNFETVSLWCRALGEILTTDWLTYWAKVFAFDALIGNTDRHHNNWGTIFYERGTPQPAAMLSPAFDNGTSLAYELLPARMQLLLSSEARLAAYTAKGRHHMKWQQKDVVRPTHKEFLRLFCSKHPSRRASLLECLALRNEEIEHAVFPLTEFDVPSRLTMQRADFLVRILKFRRDDLLIDL